MNKQGLLLLVVALFLGNFLFAQKYTISGYVEDAESGEKLIAANVFDENSLQGTVTNTYGFFSLTLEQDSVFLDISYIGYRPIQKHFFLNENTSITFKLEPAIELETVEVTAERHEQIQEETQMSRVDVPVEQIKKIPALLGEVDVLKALQLLPGVQSGGEGQSGLYIRGGSPDQNLILLDEVPVYNVSHVLGIFSVFNADAIKTVTLTKGGFPARFGGRLSSVVEINMKDGNKHEFHGTGSIGLISSKLAIEGPIKKDKTSFLVSGRRTYLDLIARPIIRKVGKAEGEDIKLKLHFYDLNAKVNHKLNDKHRLFLSFYSGGDVFGTTIKENYFDSEDTYGAGIDWGNLITAFRWNYQINKKLFANTTLTYSDYTLTTDIFFEEKNRDTVSFSGQSKYQSGIKDFAGNLHFDFIPSPSHYIRFGGGVIRHTYSPGSVNLKLNEGDEYNIDTLLGNKKTYSTEFALFAEDDMRIGLLKANVGIHASAFKVKDDFFYSIEPRIGLRYLLSDKLSVKASFATMTQYINLLASEGLTLPTDLWVPSSKKLKPQESWQAAMGVARTFRDVYEISLEGYYKKMHNVISYLPGESFSPENLVGLGDSDWEDKITQGEGLSYGGELFVQKKKGRTTGWLGYTLSWNTRQFDRINGGKSFPYRYDRRHDFSIVVIHKINDHINASAAWIYGTGNAISLPVLKYPKPRAFSGEYYYGVYTEFETLGEKNSFRMTAYHRLDASIEFHKKKKWGERFWTIGVYNAYWHKNPYFVKRGRKLDPKTGKYKTVFQEVSVLPIIPSISYNFKF